MHKSLHRFSAAAVCMAAFSVQKNSPGVRLVPLLRPLMPQSGHLAADGCSNTLIIVDTFANVRRIEAVVASLDVG